MRREYWDLALDAVRSGRVRWLVEQLWKYSSMRLAYRLERPLGGPILGALLLTYRCNNDCPMCDYPGRAKRRDAEGAKEMTTEEWKAVIDEFAAIRTSGLAFTGGEPTLRKDLLDLMTHAKRTGMVVNVNTNGNILAKEEYARRLLETGVDLINISLDGADAATHDRLRRYPGGYDMIMKGVSHLNRIRKEKGLRTIVNFVTVLSPDNIDQAEEMVYLAERVGVDHIGFMPLHAFPFQKNDLLQREAGERWLKRGREVVERLKDMKRSHPIDSSHEYLDLFPLAFEGAAENPHRCYAAYNSLMIGSYGDIFPCFPYIEWGRSVGNVRETPLREFWWSRAYDEKRREIAKCRACFWNCHSELNELFRKPFASLVS